jgi:hypothetical protein
MAEDNPAPTTNQVIIWWELRRIAYNAILFVVGIASIIVFEILMDKVLPPGEDAEEPFGLLLGVIAYGIAANICYTLGWIVELYSRRANPAVAREKGKRNYRIGLAFSCVLTTAPIWFATVFYSLHRIRAH